MLHAPNLDEALTSVVEEPVFTDGAQSLFELLCRPARRRCRWRTGCKDAAGCAGLPGWLANLRANLERLDTRQWAASSRYRVLGGVDTPERPAAPLVGAWLQGSSSCLGLEVQHLPHVAQ